MRNIPNLPNPIRKNVEMYYLWCMVKELERKGKVKICETTRNKYGWTCIKFVVFPTEVEPALRFSIWQCYRKVRIQEHTHAITKLYSGKQTLKGIIETARDYIDSLVMDGHDSYYQEYLWRRRARINNNDTL
jgi:hypothetical protein